MDLVRAAAPGRAAARAGQEEEGVAALEAAEPRGGPPKIADWNFAVVSERTVVRQGCNQNSGYWLNVVARIDNAQ